MPAAGIAWRSTALPVPEIAGVDEPAKREVRREMGGLGGIPLIIFLCAAAALVCPGRAPAAFEVLWPDARTAALCGATLDGPVSVLPGPTTAGARLFRFSGGELFGLREARGMCAELAGRLGNQALCVAVSSLGSNLYREQSVEVGCARTLGSDTAGELAVRAVGIRAEGLADRWSMAIDVGVFRMLLGRILLAARFENLGQATLGASPLPATARMGFSVLLGDSLLAVSVESEPGFDRSFALGFEVGTASWLTLRAGAGTAPGRVAAGLGVGRPEGRGAPAFLAPSLDLAWEWHQELGFSSFATVIFEW